MKWLVINIVSLPIEFNDRKKRPKISGILLDLFNFNHAITLDYVLDFVCRKLLMPHRYVRRIADHPIRRQIEQIHFHWLTVKKKGWAFSLNLDLPLFNHESKMTSFTSV